MRVASRDDRDASQAYRPGKPQPDEITTRLEDPGSEGGVEPPVEGCFRNQVLVAAA